jgi:hypothetical protein
VLGAVSARQGPLLVAAGLRRSFSATDESSAARVIIVCPLDWIDRLGLRCLRLRPIDSTAAVFVWDRWTRPPPPLSGLNLPLPPIPVAIARHRPDRSSHRHFFSNLDWIRLGVVLGCDLVVRLGSSCRLGSCYSTHLSRLASVDSG